ncbi:signal recognition particle-docking protein FtsY [Corynebacterium propinquum]|uniref:signal recognition particle-docking protein FtsY n=1 Tax=Corynebacterium propinquum TaxID=43769 RepID=UPI000F875228|nr:signal recognition particle-docking protein FtsY [Corynebacterium propinquum]RUP80276.1 signal recognition particle-docking protein FtsY [Corynebacterium propinquum]RUP90504.1 signal recognition particle-docking protein FtsY [Corynebacterium propinquum]RUP97116.1 signal recognition particle-docking protein FtsY [Corynebacterium propinquum]WKS49677.1 signal recognition particle-docking protein FtsY [Corynebacterium propinquum]
METMNTSESWWDSLVAFATNNAVAFWVIVAAVVLALIVIIALIVGTKRKKSKTVRFGGEDAEEPKQLTQQQKSGNYQATGGFNFASGGAGEKQPVVKPEPQEPTTEPREPREPLAEEKPEAQEPVETPDEAHADEPVDESAEVAEARPEKAQPDEAQTESDAQDKKTEPDTAEPVGEPAEDAEETEPETSSEAKPDVESEPVTEQEAEPEQVESEQVEPEAVEPEEAELAPEPAVEPAVKEDAAPKADAAPKDDIAPAAGRLSKLRGRLSKSQSAIGQGVLGLLTAGDLDEDAWEEIEDTLIMADLGTNATMKVTDLLRDKIAERGVSSEAEARAMLREALIEVGKPEMDRSIKAMPHDGKPAVAMIVGVNGTGKTTTTGKLGRVLVAMGHDVVFGAADTFRAAAADQLETWGRRVGATTVRGAEGADPASVAFDAVATGVDEGVDVVLVDTAGRLHTSNNLMDQLGKVKRVIEKKAEVDEVLLVIDATVGQNGLAQARVFREVVDISGVVLTKLDGTAKGGIVFQVQEELGVPVKLVGLGEGADDLAPFEIESFVDALLGNER